MRVIIILIFVSLHHSCAAQTWDEWFRQKETQKKYLLQQIAALKIYLDYAEKGYKIADQGLQTIRSIKKGDFNLHNAFFNSLKQVNPSISKWSRIADIISLQIQIVRETKETMASIKVAGTFTPEDLDYCKDVFDHLLSDCLKNIDELILVTTSGELEMKDDERIKRIETIFLDMQDKYAFSSSFSSEMQLLSVQRKNEEKEIQLSKILSK